MGAHELQKERLFDVVLLCFFCIFSRSTCRICYYTQCLRAILLLRLFCFFLVFWLCLFQRFRHRSRTVFGRFGQDRGTSKSAPDPPKWCSHCCKTASREKLTFSIKKSGPEQIWFFLRKMTSKRRSFSGLLVDFWDIDFWLFFSESQKATGQ